MIWTWLNKYKNWLFLVALTYFVIDIGFFIKGHSLSPLGDFFVPSTFLAQSTYTIKAPLGFFLFYGYYGLLAFFTAYNVFKNPNWLIKIISCLVTAYYLLIMLMFCSASRS